MFTAAQWDAACDLASHIGSEVMVATSEYSAPGCQSKRYGPQWKPVAYIKAATLRSMAARGWIRIECSYWRGATVTVLAALETAADAAVEAA